MANSETWAMVHRERAALADDLATLAPEQWDAPSQCDGWTVRDLVAHMTASAMITPPAFFAKIIGNGFGIHHDYETGAAVRVADFYKGSNLVVGAKKRVAGLHLQAADADWSHGEGPNVSGPVMSLVMAMTGRASALDDLTGDGVATLRSRS